MDLVALIFYAGTAVAILSVVVALVELLRRRGRP
jgi:hypothetical protein